VITYLTGDATAPQGPENKVIAHVCNDTGAWGRGFVLSLTKRWPKAEASYREWYQEQGGEDYPPMELGQVMFIAVEAGITVANMVGQRGIMAAEDGTPPIRYGALEECLMQVREFARDYDHASVHMPRIGCGLAGGKWSEVEEIIDRVMPHTDVYVYDFNARDARAVPWNK
jgi:O-acetyl-ADP-ribose deacetylase (regulator of RNase III)